MAELTKFLCPEPEFQQAGDVGAPVHAVTPGFRLGGSATRLAFAVGSAVSNAFHLGPAHSEGFI